MKQQKRRNCISQTQLSRKAIKQFILFYASFLLNIFKTEICVKESAKEGSNGNTRLWKRKSISPRF